MKIDIQYQYNFDVSWYPISDKKTPIHSCLTISCLNRPLLYLLSKQNISKISFEYTDNN